MENTKGFLEEVFAECRPVPSVERMHVFLSKRQRILCAPRYLLKKAKNDLKSDWEGQSSLKIKMRSPVFITGWLEDMNSIFSLENKIHIVAPPCIKYPLYKKTSTF